MEVEASTTTTATAAVTPKADETVQETSPVTKDSSPVPVIQGIKRPASVDTEEDAGERKLVIDEPQDTQVAKEDAATVDTKEHDTEGQESSQDADGIEGEIPATTGRGKRGAAAKKGTNKRARKETPAQAKTRAVRASRRRERSAAAILKIRALVPGTNPRTDHTRVIENLLAYLHFFSQAIDSSDLETFQNTFIAAKAAEPSEPSPSEPLMESMSSSDFVPPVGDDPVTSNQ